MLEVLFVRRGIRTDLSAVLREEDDSLNTTIFLELILVIAGETGINFWSNIFQIKKFITLIIC